jgi:PEP-CTERM putative exosortase interaction domain
VRPHVRSRLAAGTLLLAATLLALGSSLSAQAQITYSGGVGGQIEDGSTKGYSSTIDVLDFGTITSFNSITITGLQHSWVGDLSATLEHDGITVDLFDRIGRTGSGSYGDSSNLNGTYTIALDGLNWLTAASGGGDTYTIPSGTYAPFPNSLTGGSSPATDTFASFAGRQLGGAWTLKITDHELGDTGSFTGWHFNTTATVAPPPKGVYNNGPGGTLVDATLDIATGNIIPGVFTSDIVVTDKFAISSFNSVNLRGFFHTLAGDLTIQLSHLESGTTVDLVNRLGQTNGADPFDFGDDSNFGGTYTFTEAGSSLLDEAQLGNTSYTMTSGTYARSSHSDPAYGNPLDFSNLALDSIEGTWRLTITDYSPGDFGSLSGWGFAATAAIPEPSTLTLFPLGLAFAAAGYGIRRSRRARTVSQKGTAHEV